MSDFPRTTDKITAEWLTEVLRESGAVRESIVKSFTVSNIGVDQGVVGEVSRFELDYDMPEKTAPRAVIAKLALADDEKRELTNSLGIYRVEARFYRELASASGMATPETYFVEYDAVTGYVNLLLEDLGHLRAVDQADDCSFDDASAAVRSLARMHAKWWEDPRLSDYPWLPGSPGPEQIRAAVERFPGSLESCLENVGDYLPSGFAAIARMCGKSIPEITRLNYRGPLTLTHGDFRLANLFFDDADGATDPVVAFDWQLTRHAQGASDVGYFLCWSLGTESRRRYEKQLLTDYHDCLVDLGVEGYSYDEFIVDARRAVLKNLRIIVSVLGSSFGDDLLATDDGRKRAVALCSRLQTLIDWNCDEVIPK